MNIKDNVYQMREDGKDREEVLGVIVRALCKVKGYFVFSYDGEKYVIIAKREFDRILSGKKEKQLSFTEAGSLSEDYIEEEAAKFNRDAASAYAADGNDLAREDSRIWMEDVESGETDKRVRFEPIKGDLPPELQE